MSFPYFEKVFDQMSRRIEIGIQKSMQFELFGALYMYISDVWVKKTKQFLGCFP